MVFPSSYRLRLTPSEKLEFAEDDGGYESAVLRRSRRRCKGRVGELDNVTKHG